MSQNRDRIALLVRQGESEREDLAMAVADGREEIERRRAQWKAASMIATSIAVAASVAYRLFGKASLAARLSRIATAASLVIGLARGLRKIRRFW
ncbi:MAG TPA: hypothetical protein VKG01_10425 [Thermoanaerobaculia bacterium]|nr:hypothetical protein [Thermoanaerobaculia bacterium]